jgi:hypothetical protein
VRPIHRTLIPVVAAGLIVVLGAGLAQALPGTTPDNTGMIDFPGAGGGGNAVAVRTIQQLGANVWVGGVFSEIDDANGNRVQDAANLAAFNATTGLLAAGVHLPLVTQTGGGAEVYDASIGPDGNLYFAGIFDAVDGQARKNVAAVNAATGALLPFAPNAATATAVLATASAIYVGTGKLLSFQLNGAPTPGYTAPVAIINAALRAHETLPQFRDIALQGSTLVAACQCDSLTDANGTRTVKAVVEIDATSGNWVNWAPANLPSSGANISGAFGINLIVHAYPTTGAPTIYLAAGGSDFTAAYDFATGAQRFKTDTSGSSQAITWYQGTVVVGGHFDWTESPTVDGSNDPSCHDNGTPNTACYHTPKLAAMNATTGVVLLNPNSTPWNPGICCKYNGVWTLLTGTDGQTLHVGGEFTQVGGTWSGSGTNWNLVGGSNQKFYARLGGPTSTVLPLTVQKVTTANATGTVTSAPNGISCGVSCASSGPIDFNRNTSVTLTAAATGQNTFTGWSSSDPNFTCPGTGTCTVTMDVARTVVATFAGPSYALSVTKVGNGTVSSSPAGLSCGGTCSSFFAQNTVVTLSATPGPNFSFTAAGAGWSGAGCSGTGTCVVTMDQAKNVTATFVSTNQTLTVGRTGSGQGSVSSSPAGINCGATCTKAFSVSTVTLTASPAGGSVFNGWSGGGCAGLEPTCAVTMDAAKTVLADFEPARNVTLTFAGTGGGTVASDLPGLNCSASCQKSFAQGSTVTLTAAPDGSSVFTGWSGAGGCTGTATCVLTMSGGKAVTATFQPAQMLTVTPAGLGGGTIGSDVPGINCGLTCSANYLSGTTVTLSAVPDANSTFTGWSGEGCSGTGSCVVTMTQARGVTATFTLVPRALTVHVEGQGSMTDNPGPINCAGPEPDTGTCGASYQHGTDVQLVAFPAANWSFTGWSGDCAGFDSTPNGDPICIASMTAARDVTATFERISRSVTVAKAGSGTGYVSSDVPGIDCGPDCAEGYNQGDSVVLTAVADAGSVFTGWSGDCSGAGACNLTIDAMKSVTATFELLHTLAVTTAGSGTGQVTSDVGGIACPATNCVAPNRTHGTHVVLSATPDPGSAFAGWSGGGCSGNASTCDVTMNGDATVTATFAPVLSLNVTLAGSGGGSVTSTPGGLTCPSTCTAGFAQNGSVTLHAAADGSSVFVGWGSTDTGFSCPGTADCVVTMDQARSVTATFQPVFALAVTKTGGTGTGTVTSLAPNLGINCGATCQFSFQQGVSVSLHAAADTGSVFAGWSGGGCSGTADCVVTMNAAQSVNAVFNATGGGCSGTLKDNDPCVTYNGWTGVTDAAANGGAYRMSSVKTDKATWKSPVATSITWVTRTGPDQGKAKVVIDGGTPVTVDLYSATNAAFSKVFSGLPSKAHTVVITVLHTKNAASTGFTVRLDAFQAGVTTVQESDPSITYDLWVSTAQTKATDGRYRAAAKSTATVTVTFTGTSIDWVTAMGKAFGQARVSVDGGAPTTVDLYQATAVWQKKIPSATLAAGTHTLTIQVLGTKSSAATGTKVIVDGFIVHP